MKKITNRPDPNAAFPNPKIPSLCFIKNVVKNPRIIIGKVRIITEFESFLGGTVATVLNIHDVQKALNSMEQESEIKLTEEAAKAINKAKDGAVSFGTSASETVKTWGSNVGSKMKSWGSSAGSSMKNWGSSAGSTIKSWGHSISDFFGNARQSIGKGWNGLVDKVKSTVSAVPGAASFV